MEGLPDRLAHDRAGAVGPDPADLLGDEFDVFAGVVGEVIAELFLAHLREGLVGFQFGVACLRRGGRGSARGGGSATACGPKSSGVFGDHGGADLFRVAFGGQVGARVEDLAAAGRDGHEPVMHDRVADRPGRDHDDDPGRDDRRGEERARQRRAVEWSRSSRQEDDRERGENRSPGTRAGPGRAPRGSVPAPASARARSRPRRPEDRQGSPRPAASPPAARSSASPCTGSSPDRSRRRAPRSAPPPPPAREPLSFVTHRVTKDTGLTRGEAAGQEVGEEDGEGSDHREGLAGEAFVDAAGHLVDRRRRTGAGRGSSRRSAGSRPRRP